MSKMCEIVDLSMRAPNIFILLINQFKFIEKIPIIQGDFSILFTKVKEKCVLIV